MFFLWMRGMLSREDRAVQAAWERVQQQERKGSEKRRRDTLKSRRKAQVLLCTVGPSLACLQLCLASPTSATSRWLNARQRAHDACMDVA